MKTQDIYWIAGLLEGEGSFLVSHGSPRIKLTMTDRDIVSRFHSLVRATSNIQSWAPGLDKFGKPYKLAFSSVLNGRQAAGIMMTIYPLMGVRRKEQIKRTLTEWRKRPVRLSPDIRSFRCNFCGVLRFRRMGTTIRYCPPCRRKYLGRLKEVA